MLLADLLFFAGRRYFERYYGITLAEATVFGILRRYGLNRFPGRVGRRSITMYRSAQHVPGHHVSISRSLGKDGKPIRRYQYTAGGLGVVSGSSATDSFHLGPVGYREALLHSSQPLSGCNRGVEPKHISNRPSEPVTGKRVGQQGKFSTVEKSYHEVCIRSTRRNAKDSKKKSSSVS